MKLIMVRIAAAWALLLGPALGENDGYCYDAEQHPVRFSDLGSRLDITQALNETCETPIGDHMYACNAAVSAQAKKRARRQTIVSTSLPTPNSTTVLLTRITHFHQKALNVPMPNDASRTFVFHFASLHYVNQSIPDTGPCGDVYLSRASCVYLGLAAIDMCERGGEVTINETVAAGGGEERPVTAWLQVIPFM